MSANDYIKIEKVAENSFVVSHRDSDTDGLIEKIGDFLDVEIALEEAEKYMREAEYPVEYGIRFVVPIKKKSSNL
jgi:hypothetical protein